MVDVVGLAACELQPSNINPPTNNSVKIFCSTDASHKNLVLKPIYHTMPACVAELVDARGLAVILEQSIQSNERNATPIFGKGEPGTIQ
jgi:hypothetical protein